MDKEEFEFDAEFVIDEKDRQTLESIINFSTEFMTDEEVAKMLDSVVIETGRLVAEADNRPSIINPREIQKVSRAYEALKILTQEIEGIEVTYELHKPYRSMGSVSVVGKHLDFREPEWIMRVTGLASSFEVYAKTDGTVQMDFGFHGLTTPIK